MNLVHIGGKDFEKNCSDELTCILKSSLSPKNIPPSLLLLLKNIKDQGIKNKTQLNFMLNLQLFFQRLGEFSQSMEVRKLIYNSSYTNRILQSKIMIDAGIIPKINNVNIINCRSKIDFYTLMNIIRLKKILSRTEFNNNLFENVQQSKQFSDLVYRKRIALVGPGFTDSNLGKEIDSHDVVVRINIKSDSNLPNEITHGSKTHVLYLNGRWSREFKIDKYKNLISNSCYVVFRNNIWSTKIKRSHTLVPLDFIELSGSLLMLPRILVDLVGFNPEVINIYNSDFYSGLMPYTENFKTMHQGANLWQLAGHDLITNLNFTNFIINNVRTRITFDNSFYKNGVLDLSKYIELMNARKLSW